MTATIKDLRARLAAHFEGVEQVLQRLREADLLPFGKPGRDGVGSAVIAPRHAALALLALASLAWDEPINCPIAAQSLANMRLRRAFNGHQPADDAPTAGDTLAGELTAAAGAIANHQPARWTIAETSVERAGDPQDPHDPTLVFMPDEPADEKLVVRQTIIAPELLGLVAALFAPGAPVSITAAELDAGAATLGMGRA